MFDCEILASLDWILLNEDGFKTCLTAYNILPYSRGQQKFDLCYKNSISLIYCCYSDPFPTSSQRNNFKSSNGSGPPWFSERFLLLQDFSIAISERSHNCFILVLIGSLKVKIDV